MQLMATAAAVVDVMVVSLEVMLARTILPPLDNALLVFYMLRWG
jgi:hypothetical protein